MADDAKISVISDRTRGAVDSFRGTVLQSIVTIALPIGVHTAKVVSEASFRSFVAGENSKRAGAEFGVLECKVTTEPTKNADGTINDGVTLSARLDKSFMGFVGQVVKVEVTEANGYKNAVIL